MNRLLLYFACSIMLFLNISCDNMKILGLMHKYFKKTLVLKDNLFYTSDGYEIAYSDNLVQNKPTLLFIHGYHVSRENFYFVASQFKKGNYRLILIDLPGFGESSRFPDGDYKLTSQAKRVNELIKYLKLENVHLASTSLGGGVAIALNGINPEIKSSTLIAPFGMPLYAKELPNIIKYFIETGEVAFHVKYPYNQNRTKKLIGFALNVPSFLIPNFLLAEIKMNFIKGYMATNKTGEDILYDKYSFITVLKENSEFAKFGKIMSDLGINVNDYINNSTNFAALLNIINKNKNVKSTDPIGNSFEDMTPYLKSIENPILVIWGDKDQIIHYKTMETMLPHIKNGTYKIIKNGSHSISSMRYKIIAREMKKIIN